MDTPEHDLERIRLYPLSEEVTRALDGAVFPLSREQLIVVARENEAPTTLLTLFYGIPDRTYRTLDGVQRAVDEIALAAAARG